MDVIDTEGVKASHLSNVANHGSKGLWLLNENLVALKASQRPLVP